MEYYGIKTPKKDRQDSYIHWLAKNEHEAWSEFFTYPCRDGNFKSYRYPLAEAIQAYKGLGYECVKLAVNEIDE